VSWDRRAACRGYHWSLFTTVGEHYRTARPRPEAAELCARCPVRDACLHDANYHDDYRVPDLEQRFGLVRAGLTPYQRQQQLTRGVS
jgi:hypothetical protein